MKITSLYSLGNLLSGDVVCNCVFHKYLIAEEWDKLDQRIIDKAVGEWRKRLQACVAAGGGHFEHKM